jgi:hypothetical protein
MNEISSGLAFWIFDAWRKMTAQLKVVGGVVPARSRESAVVIQRVSPNTFIIALDISDTLGEKKGWDVFLGNARFSFGVVPEASSFPELRDGSWVSFLQVQFSNGDGLLFGERSIKEK